MQGIVIYNGSSKTKKVQSCAKRIFDEAISFGIKMHFVKNSDIINFIDENNNIQIIYPHNIYKPDFVIAFDKDTNLIEMIEKTGVRTYNSSFSIKNCDEKALMHKILTNSGIKIPKTIIAPLVFKEYDFDKEYYDKMVGILGEDFILKESIGSFGMQVYKVDSFDTFLSITKSISNRTFIMQQNIVESTGRDIRVSIVNDKVIGAMYRENENDFRANITLGGKATFIEADKNVLDVALKAHKALSLNFSGVDILLTKDGTPILCEVNSNPNFLSFENASNINYARKIVEFIIEDIKNDRIFNL